MWHCRRWNSNLPLKMALFSAALIILTATIGCMTPLYSAPTLPPEHIQEYTQQSQERRIRELEMLAAKQQEVIEALKTELKKFKESERTKKP